MTIKALYPTVRPSLNLDFAKTKALDPRITFTRASTATFVGADGLIQTAASGAARFDQNPSTGESLGLLVEEAKTNLITNSGPASSWPNKNGAPTIISTTNLAPDGTNTATSLILSPGTYYIGKNLSIASSTSVHTASVYVKNSEATNNLMVEGASSAQILFSFTGSVLTSAVVAGGTPTAYGFTDVGNGWYRVWISSPPNGNTTFSFMGWFGGADKTLQLWGGQVELGTFPTSYIPTVASTVTRAADVATLANTGSSVFPTSAFTTVNSPFGTAGGGTSFKLVGPTVKRTAVYSGDLTQAQINALAGVNDNFWRWRVLGSSFALPNFTTNGSVTVDWGDGVVETLTTAVHTFTNGGGYHDIGFRLNSGTYFLPLINENATYAPRVIALGPAPASMKVDANVGFAGCSALRSFDATLDATGGTSFSGAWAYCSSLTSFPLINTAAVTNFQSAWLGCSGLTSFPLINTAAVTNFQSAWLGCSGLTSFPLINTAAGTNFGSAWQGLSALTSFPLISTAAGTNFQQAWLSCSGLTSFPLINTGSGTNFQSAWQGLSALTSFPLVNTAAGTNFLQAWYNCSGLTSFPLIDTSAGTNFQSAWHNCSGLTSFPLINTAAGTNFFQAWLSCSGLTSFPLINTAAGTNFQSAWQGLSALTSFPLVNTAAGTNFLQAWYNCTNLSSFPANMFNATGTLVATAFTNAFLNCALTAASIENILTSLVTNGQSNITLDLNGGTNAGASTWTANAIAAYATLISRGWTITRNA